MLYYTQIIKKNWIINELINDRSYHFINKCRPVMIDYNQWENKYIFSGTDP